jgi:hypothetical protein
MAVLDEGPLYAIEEVRGVVTCQVVSRPDVSADEGARSAERMQQFLVDRVLRSRSPYLGLVFDVSQGPAVFGPRTREALSQLFRAAARSNKPVAVRVGDAAIQRLQFTSLCRECAPEHTEVLSNGDAVDWVASWANARSGARKQ